MEQGVREPERVLSQSAGAPLAALRLADAAYQAERTVWLDALGSPVTLDPIELAARIDRAPRDARKLLLGAAIDWLAAWCADIAAAKAGASPMRNTDYAPVIASIATVVAPLPLFRCKSALKSRTRCSRASLPKRCCSNTKSCLDRLCRCPWHDEA